MPARSSQAERAIEGAIRDGIKRFPKSVTVREFRWLSGLDHAGRPAVFVDLMLKHSRRRPQLNRLSVLVHDAFLARDIEAWPYVSFREE